MPFFKKMIVLCIMAMLPLHSASASSLSEAVLRFTGISVTASQVKGSDTKENGNLWQVKVDGARTSELKRITSDRTYRSPLWIPRSDKILAVKENKLVQLNSDGSDEKILHPLNDSTILVGFDKHDAKSILILQDLVPAVLSLDNGQIMLLPYDKQNLADRNVLDHLMNDSRDYGTMNVFIEKQNQKDASGYFKKINKIRIKVDQEDTVIPCPANCAQPALTEDGKQLVFVGP